MTARALLYCQDGALRAPWRIAAFFASTAACAVVAGGLLAPLQPLAATAGIPGLSEWVVVVVAVSGGTALTLHWIDRRPWSFVWLHRSAARPGVLAEGSLLGLLAIGLPCAALLSVGWLAIEPSAAGSWTAAAVRVSLLLLLAALAEELLFRGYLFAVLRERLGTGTALAITGVAFGYAHASNPGASVGALSLVALAGLFLGAVVVATKSLYAAWLAHFGWNWTMAVLLHIPVSGGALETPDYRTVDAGPDWATGGSWGPEGGAGGAIGMVAGLGYLAARHRRRVA